jgi:hypothetical protein
MQLEESEDGITEEWLKYYKGSMSWEKRIAEREDKGITRTNEAAKENCYR